METIAFEQHVSVTPDKGFWRVCSPLWSLLLPLLMVVCLPRISRAAIDTQTNLSPADLMQLTNRMNQAIDEVKRIVNQPVTRVPITRNVRPAIFNEGWFHPGATEPHYSSVDIRTTQEFPYDKYTYVSSTLNPGVAFIGRELEFNSMTKFFYVDRSLPKKKLTQNEMLRINALYRVIGECKSKIIKATHPIVIDDADSAMESDEVPPPDTFAARIERIPRQRLLIGGMGICLILVLYLTYKLVSR